MFNFSPEKAAELARSLDHSTHPPSWIKRRRPSTTEGKDTTIAGPPKNLATLPTSDAEALFAGLENLEKWPTVQRIPTASSVSTSGNCYEETQVVGRRCRQIERERFRAGDRPVTEGGDRAP
jgi:hypothetical protein